MISNAVVALYIRVSTQEQASEGYSIDEQRERLVKYAEAQSWSVYRVYSDPGFSGGSLERPGLRSLILDVNAGKVNKVVVYKLDRLSRSQKDTLYLIEDVFLPASVDFVSMTENFDTGTPLGRAMIGILSVFAQLEREQIKERMSLGREGRAKSGLFHGSNRSRSVIGMRTDNSSLIRMRPRSSGGSIGSLTQERQKPRLRPDFNGRELQLISAKLPPGRFTRLLQIESRSGL